MANGVFTPYSTISPFTTVFPSWVPELDKERIASYQTYEEIYWNHPETFELMVRGSDSLPIYLPSGRIIVDTMNRYMCKRLGFNVIPAPGVTAGAEQELAKQVFDDWFMREAFKTKFSSSKLYGIMRGDWLFHIVANPNKVAGTRVSVRTVDPATYFPVYADDDLDRLEKVHLAEEFVDTDGKTRLRKETYEKVFDNLGNQTAIMYSLAVYDPDKAFKIDGAPEYVVVNPTPLDPRITTIPVYHIKNFEQPANPFGSSEMRGLERIMASMNQSISDEDIALALEGLGVYTTASGSPVDEEGADVPWVIAPGRVIDNLTEPLERVKGIDSVAPFADHIGMLWDFTKMASGTNDAAIGKVDVQVAESGIALQMQMAPILSRAEEKQDMVSETLAHLFYDLRNWFLVYESWNLENTRILPTFGDPLPQNRKAEVGLLTELVTGKIMSAETARAHAAKLGFVFAPNEAELIAGAAAQEAAAVDPFGARLNEESGTGSTDEGAADGAE